MHPPFTLRGKTLRGLRLASLAALAALAIVACNKQEADSAPSAADAPAPEVAVIKAKPQSVSLSTDLPGRLEPSREAQVRARATGILLKRHFNEGSDIQAGQKLYQIDPAPYDAALQSARASLAQAEAKLAETQATANRYKPLVQVNAVSQQEYDMAVAAAKTAAAQVEAAKAAINTASIDRGYANVTAPISGRIGRSLVTEGALVNQQEGTQLALIQQIDPMYLNVTQSAAEILRLRENLSKDQEKHGAEVEIRFRDGKVYPHKATLLFTDLTVDPGTGEVLLRATVPNPDGLLLPGMFVRAHIEQEKLDDVILIPQQALTRGSHGDTVLVIKDDGSFENRPVTVDGQTNHQWIVSSGLEAGEQVLVEGQMKISMGAQKVKAVAWKPEAEEAPEQPAQEAADQSRPADATADEPAHN